MFGSGNHQAQVRLFDLTLQLLVIFMRHAELMCPGIPTDEEQATGLEKIIMTAMKEGSVR